MIKIDLVTILDQRKYLSHLIFLSLSLVTVLLVWFFSDTPDSFAEQLKFFLFLFIQLEVFIFIASRIFTELSVGLSSRQFTRVILFRFILFIFICFIAAFLLFLSFRYLVAFTDHRDLSLVWRNILDYEIRNWISSTLKGLSLGAVIFVIIQWQDALKREQKLREENLIFQNETLRNQVNPHFLFNSLNTLSALIKPDAETAELFTCRLASIYRYILENNSTDKVPLEKEIEFIKDYFFLHSVRGENKIVMDINVIDPDNYQILPVSLQLLVENAIKHNMATREKPLIITVTAEGEYIVVKNNIQKMAVSVKTTRIGLKNLGERVRIVTGENIIVEETNEFFTVKMPLIR